MAEYTIALIRTRLITERQVVTVQARSEDEAHREAWEAEGSEDCWQEVDSTGESTTSEVLSVARDRTEFSQ